MPELDEVPPPRESSSSNDGLTKDALLTETPSSGRTVDGDLGTAEVQENNRQFPRDDVVAMVVQAALQRFGGEIAEFRTLLRLVARARVEHERPRELKRLGDEIGRDRRRRGEEAIREMRPVFESEIERAFGDSSESETESAPSRKRYPWAPEQLAALAMVSTGHARLNSLLGELVTRCGEDQATMRYALGYLAWTSQSPPVEVLAEVLLPPLVASFENLVAALVRLWATLHPEALNVHLKDLKGGDVLDYETRDDLVRLLADRRAEEFVSERPEDWARRFSDGLRIDLAELADDWPAVLEVFARRNVVVHSGGRVDAPYLARLGHRDEPPTVGSRLQTDESYIATALDRLEWLGNSLGLLLLAHFAPAGSYTAGLAHQTVVRALETMHWREARIIASVVLQACADGDYHHELRVNLWMARRELDDDWDDFRAEIMAWQPPAGQQYHVAKAALLRDAGGTLSALADCLQSGDIDVEYLATWPLVRAMAEQSPRIKTWLTQHRSPRARPAPPPSRGRTRPRR